MDIAHNLPIGCRRQVEEENVAAIAGDRKHRFERKTFGEPPVGLVSIFSNQRTPAILPLIIAANRIQIVEADDLSIVDRRHTDVVVELTSVGHFDKGSIPGRKRPSDLGLRGASGQPLD